MIHQLTDERSIVAQAEGMATEAMQVASAAGQSAGQASTRAQTAESSADSATQVAAAAKVKADEAEAASLLGKVAWIADVTITYNSVISLSLAPRMKAFLPADAAQISKAKVGDRFYVHHREIPKLSGINVLSGVMIEGTGFVPSDGSVEIYHVIPAVGLNQALTIPLRLVGFRPATI